jgi:hypothetical protein
MIGLGLALFVVLVAVIGPFVATNPPDDLVTLAFGKPSGQFPLAVTSSAATCCPGYSTAAGCC